jgi:hypothetical protein
VDRLCRQPCAQVAPVAEDDANGADAVVQRLVAAPEGVVVDRRGEVLQVDPRRDDHRGREDERQDRRVGVEGRVVLVQERAPPQVHAPRAPPSRGDERGVARQRPFRAHLGPVARPAAQQPVEAVGLLRGDAERPGALLARPRAGAF